MGGRAGVEGFEPSTIGFGDRCSSQLELHPYGEYFIMLQDVVQEGSIVKYESN